MANKQIIGWRVKDFADGWVYFKNEVDALNEAIRTGAKFEPVFERSPLRRGHGGFDCNNTPSPDGRDGSPF